MQASNFNLFYKPREYLARNGYTNDGTHERVGKTLKTKRKWRLNMKNLQRISITIMLLIMIFLIGNIAFAGNCPSCETGNLSYNVTVGNCHTKGQNIMTCNSCSYTRTVDLGYNYSNHTGGTLRQTVTTPATCTSAGVMTVESCSLCNYHESSTEAIAPIAHTYSSSWSHDAYNHYHLCTMCNTAKSNETAHTFDAGVITTAPTANTPGVKTYTCTVCSYSYTESVLADDVTPPTLSNIEIGYVDTNGDFTIRSTGISDGTNGSGLKSITYNVSLDGTSILTRTKMFTTQITEDHLVVAYDHIGNYRVDVTLTDNSNNSSTAGTYTSTKHLEREGIGYVTIADWAVGETPSTPQPYSTTNDTNNMTYYYKQLTAADSTYTTTVPTAIGNYTLKAVFAATNVYSQAIAYADFNINAVQVPVHSNILKDTTKPSFNAPTFGNLSERDIRINLTNISDGSGGSGVKYIRWVLKDESDTTIYSVTHTFAVSPTSDYIQATITGSGTYTVYAEVEDAYGNKQTKSTSKNLEIAIQAYMTKTEFEYNGSTIEPASFIVVKEGATVLTAGTHYTVSYSNNLNAGTATATITGKSGTVYSGSSISLNYTITQRQLIIKANNISIGYGVAIPPLNYTVSNAVDGQVPTITGTFKTTATSTSAPGTYAISNNNITVANTGTGGFLKSNYDVKIVTGSLTIKQGIVTAVASGYTGPYDGGAHSITVSVTDPVTNYSITYCEEGQSTFTPTNPTRTECGTTVVYYMVSAPGYTSVTGSATINITSISMAGFSATLGETEYVYNGFARTPTATVKDGSNNTLTAGTDYTIKYENNIDVGGTNGAKAIIEGTGSYSGTIIKYFTINPASITVTPDALSKAFGQADPILTYGVIGQISGQTPAFTGELVRVAGEAVGTYNINAGTLEPRNNGTFRTSNYTMSFTTGKKFTITGKPISSSDILVYLYPNEFDYTGSAITPLPVIKDGSTTLVKDTHYTLGYANNTNVGTATITITGKGNYAGSRTVTFKINKLNITVTPNNVSKVYGASDPAFTYTISGTNNSVTVTLTRQAGENVGQYEFISGTCANTNYNIIVTPGRFLTITGADFTSSLSQTTYTYDGSKHEPAVTISNPLGLVLGTDYKVEYINSTDAGTATCIITGLGNYAGTEKRLEYTISKKSLTINATATSKAYGEDNPTLNYTVSNLISGQIPNYSGSLQTTATKYSMPGTYPIDIGSLKLGDSSTFKADNYSIGFTGANLTVTAKTIDYVASGYNGAYDELPHTISINVMEPPATSCTIEYGTTLGSYSSTKPTRTAVGSTEVFYRIKADGYTTVTGSAMINISNDTLNDARIVLSQTSFTYTGTPHTPTVTVYVGTEALIEGTDYTVSYVDNKDAGTGNVVITGTGSAYEGSKSASFIINPAPLVIKPTGSYSKIYQEADPPFNVIYEGLQNGETPEKTGKIWRAEGENVGSYELNDIGSYRLVENGLFNPANYDISFEKNDSYLTINPRDISTGTVTFYEEVIYDGTAKEPIPLLVVNDTTLAFGVDFTIAYTNNVNFGTGTATLTGIGNYTGTKIGTFEIQKANLERFKLNATLYLNPTSYTYDGTPKEPATRVVLSGKELVRGTDYDVTYINNVNVGTNSAIARATGKGNYEGVLQATFSILPIELAGTGSLEQTRFEYDGTAKEPKVSSVTLTDGTKLNQGIDYTVTYVDNINAGPAKAVITGTGRFGGTIEIGFEINKTTPVISIENMLVPSNGSSYTMTNAVIQKIYNYGGTPNDSTAYQSLIFNYYGDDTLKQTVSGKPSEKGTYYVQVELPEDTNHNLAKSNVAKLIIFGNPVAPQITANDGNSTVPSGSAVSSKVYVNIFGGEVAEAKEVLVGYQYSLDGNTWFDFTEMLEIVDPGTTTIYARTYVKDYPEMVSPATTYVITIDNTAPSDIDINIPDKIDSVVLEVEVTDDDIEDILITEDSSFTPTGDDESEEWNNVGGEIGEDGKTVVELSQGDGIKTLYVWGRDKAGNIVGPKTKNVVVNAIKIGNMNNNETSVYFKVTDKYLHTSNITASDIKLYVNGFDTTGYIKSLTKEAIQGGYKFTGVMKNVTGNGELSFNIDNILSYDKAGNYASEGNEFIETKEITIDNTLPILRVSANEDKVSVYAEDEHIKAVIQNGAIIGRKNGTYEATLINGHNLFKVIDEYGNEATQELDYNNILVDDSSVANSPELLPGMRAVYYVGSEENIANYFTETMYNYSKPGANTENTSSKWANAVASDGSYFVWIPRFAYKPIYYTDNTMSQESETPTEFVDYDVIFLRERGNDYLDMNGKINVLPEGYIISKAFTKEGGANYELRGFWMAKYEMSREDSTDNGITWSPASATLGGGNVFTTNAGNTHETIRVVSKSGTTPWRGISVSNAYDNSINMLPEDGSHLMKNSEYEASLVLGLSEYGRNGNYITLDSSLNTGADANTSTTGNGTGVFDMIGGSYEYTSTYINNSTLQNYARSLVAGTNTGVKEVITNADINKIILSKAEKTSFGNTFIESPYLTSHVVYRGLDYTSSDMAMESIPVGGSPDERVSYRVVLFSDATNISDNTSAPSHTITFNANGGSLDRVPAKVTKNKGENIIITLEEPSRSGYIFYGWATSKDAEISEFKAGDTYSEEKSVTLYAVWREPSTQYISGADFNVTIKELSGQGNVTTNTSNALITKIEWSEVEPKTDSQDVRIVSTPESALPIYAWFKDGTIYLYSEADKVSMPDSAKFMFRKLNALESLNPIINLGVTQETSNVTDMSFMFADCLSLKNIDLSSSNFVTRNVSDMTCMFDDCKQLIELDVTRFDTSKVKDMGSMFRSCEKIENLNVSNFNTKQVSRMSMMFSYCSSLLSLDLKSFDTSNVLDFRNMFSDCVKLHSVDLSSFDTSKVTDMYWMFYNCKELNSLDLRSFDTSNVTTMEFMFGNCTKLETVIVSSFNTSKVWSMDSMFYNCKKLESLDLSNFDTSLVTSMDHMFYCCEKLESLDLSNFDTSKVKDMCCMFQTCTSLAELNISSFNTSEVTDISGMFKECSKLQTIDVSSFNTSQVTTMSSMFKGCSQLTTIYASDNFRLWRVTSSSEMFKSCTLLVGGAGTTYNSAKIDKTYARIDEGTSKPGYFTAK